MFCLDLGSITVYRRGPGGSATFGKGGPNQWKGKGRPFEIPFYFHYTVNHDQSGIISNHGDEFIPACAACQLKPQGAAVTSRRFFSVHLPAAQNLHQLHLFSDNVIHI